MDFFQRNFFGAFQVQVTLELSALTAKIKMAAGYGKTNN